MQFFNFRKFLGLAPYNRPRPTLADFNARDFTTVAVRVAENPLPNIFKTSDGRWAIAGTGKTYSRRRDAVRGHARMIAA